MSKKIPAYYVDTNIIIHLGTIDKIKRSGVDVPVEMIKEEILKNNKQISEADLDSLINLYMAVMRGEARIVVTPSVVFEMGRGVLAGKYTEQTSGALFMFRECYAKCPQKRKKKNYEDAVKALGTLYSENHIFPNDPKDKLDRTIMAEVSIDENARFLKLSDLNLTWLMAEIANKQEEIYKYTGKKEMRKKAYDADEAFKAEFFANPHYKEAVRANPGIIQNVFITLDEKQFLRPKYKKVPIAEIICMKNAEFNARQVKPMSPSDYFSNKDKKPDDESFGFGG